MAKTCHDDECIFLIKENAVELYCHLGFVNKNVNKSD